LFRQRIHEPSYPTRRSPDLIPIPAADDNARADDQQNQHAQEHDPKSAPPASGPEDGYCTPSHHESPFSRGTADRKWLLALVRWEAGFTCVMAGARTPERVTHRNGYRERAWDHHFAPLAG